MRKSSLALFAVVLLPTVAGCAASPEPLSRKDKARLERAEYLLAQRTDADSLAAAGLMSRFEHPDLSLRRVAQATLKAPERADLAWLHIQLCLTDSTCDPQPLEMRLRAIDEKNGAGWLGAMARASKGGDEEAISTALAAISRSERVDTYWTPLIARLTRQLASTGALSLFEAESYVVGALAAIVIPAYQAVSNVCKGERLLRADVVEKCRGVANSFLNGDTGITEMIGAAIATRAWPENSAKWKEAAEARRIWDYRAKALGSLDVWHEAHASELLALNERYRREQDVMKGQLIAAGKNPNPPSVEAEPTQGRAP